MFKNIIAFIIIAIKWLRLKLIRFFATNIFESVIKYTKARRVLSITEVFKY
jgi:hypothetical protein